MSAAPTQAARPSTAPTERSMPPVITTSVRPAESRNCSAACRSRITMLSLVRKPGPGNQDAVRQSGEQAHAERGGDGGPERRTASDEEQAHRHAGEAEHRAEAQVDALGEDD